MSRGVVRFDNGCCHLWAAPHREGNFALLSIVHLIVDYDGPKHMDVPQIVDLPKRKLKRKYPDPKIPKEQNHLQQVQVTDKRSNIKQPKPDPVPPPHAL